MKTTVIYHSADFDGLFCREIAKKFLPDAELIGWDFPDAPLDLVGLGRIYVLDLPVDRVFGFTYNPEDAKGCPPQNPEGLFWIDHHKTSIDTHPEGISGYRIDGVAACRLAWQWFTHNDKLDEACETGVYPVRDRRLPTKEEFVNRTVTEPLAVRLAGEYDIWDKRDPRAELFQHGLRSEPLTDGDWKLLLSMDNSDGRTIVLLEQGRVLQYSKTKENESIITHQGFTLELEGLKFLACNSARYNSQLFAAGLKSEHDGCLGFNWDGKQWRVSLYHATGKEHHDLSAIAKKFGGGGHRGACGFQVKELPFALQ